LRLNQLRVENLRNLATLELELGPGLNVFVGQNGAGKTSVLEAAYLLAHAQSFRAGLTETLIRHGADQMAVSAWLERSSGPLRVGLARQGGRWQPRVNGAPDNLGAMLREFAVVCFEPGSHALISGGSSERRRFLDWGVFHVEPEFLGRARQYRRALRQRNSLLKQAVSDEGELDAWDHELAEHGERLAAIRADYVTLYVRELVNMLGCLLPELGAATLDFDRGWSGDSALAPALRAARNRDRSRGHTTLGPHRADWRIGFAQAPQREHLSRGQEKLCALACVLAQGLVYASARGEWPVIALDDLASELDLAHQRLVVDMLAGVSAQVLISGIEVPDCLQPIQAPSRVFHVEHGRLRALL